MFTAQKRRPVGYVRPPPPPNDSAKSKPSVATVARKQIVTTTQAVTIKKPPPPSNAYRRPAYPTPSSSAASSSQRNGLHSKRKNGVEEGARTKKMKSKGEDYSGRAIDRKHSSPEESDESDNETARRRGVDTLMAKKSGNTDPVERAIASSEDGNVDCLTAEKLVLDNIDAYVEHFVDPSDPTRSAIEWSGSKVPTVVLEYPGIGATERFSLLAAARGAEEYDPITDLMGVIRLILDSFLTPAQSLAHFSHTLASAMAFSAFLSAPTSRDATPDNSPITSAFPVSSVAASPTAQTTTTTNPLPLIRVLEKARARKDGPAFMAAIERFNIVMRSLKAEGKIQENIQAMKGVGEKMWIKVVAQVYERAVGPEIEQLSKYEAFSDNVYGELLPRFMTEICQQTGLGPNDVFVDLGSGVGNCVVQVALATGCEAYGYENMHQAAHLASKQVVEAEARFRMYGITAGKMRTVEADFCEDAEVQEVLKRATVVLVNNEVFSAGLNDRLSLLFLDLPTNARIVSLKAFASSFTLSAYTLNSPLAMIEQGAERKYGRKSVSWKDEGGSYYIGRVDRDRVERWKKKEERRKARRASRSAENV